MFTGSQILSFLNKFPSELKYILRKVRKGELYYHVEYHGLEPVTRKLNGMANRLIMAMIICTLVLCSTLLLIYPGAMPMIYNIPVPSWVGFMISAVMSLLLMLSMMRNR